MAPTVFFREFRNGFYKGQTKPSDFFWGQMFCVGSR